MGCHSAGDASWLSTPHLFLLSHGQRGPDVGTGGMRGRLCDARRNKERIDPESLPVAVVVSLFSALKLAVSLAQKSAPSYASWQVTGKDKPHKSSSKRCPSTALLHRWSAMLIHAAATAYAASLQVRDGAFETNVEGSPAFFSELLAQTRREHPPARRLGPPAS